MKISSKSMNEYNTLKIISRPNWTNAASSVFFELDDLNELANWDAWAFYQSAREGGMPFV